MTFGPLTDDLGAELLTWFLEGSRARTSVSQDGATGSTANDPACGPKWRGSLAKYDPDTRSWKTAQHSLLGGSDEFSETWPRWGTTVAGELYLLPTLVHPTGANESGLWQTPVADDAVERTRGKWNSRGEPKLSAEVKLWPTPVASDTGLRTTPYAQGWTPLSMAAGMCPTPTVCGNYNRKGASATSGDGLATFAGGSLNPTWVEWLMGWPLGWTDLRPLGTDKCQPQPRLRGAA